MIRLVRSDDVRPWADAQFDRLAAQIRSLCPAARIEHVGSTAVPESWTKGDLDVCVIVLAGDFETAEKALASRFPRNTGSTAETNFASFLAPEPGIQLVVEGSALDLFCRFRDLLRANAGLRAEYDTVKQAHAAAGTDGYREAKRRFIEQALHG